MVHWADVEAETLGTGRQLFATAITPSGPIHVGNMREVLTTEAIFRSSKESGADAELLYIADDYDPLRKVYPFLEGHPNNYAQYVGMPLREIPCPCGDHDNYAAHFLAPFLANLEALGIRPTVLSAYDMYQEGRYAEATVTSLDQIDTVRTVIEEVSGRQLAKRWSPFNAQCPTCRRLSDTEVVDYVKPILHAKCRGCAEGSGDPEAGMFEVDVSTGGGGKLAWRVDWPARWKFLGVTFEAFGKDHGAKGGSWDSGKRLIREVFDGKEPHHLMYEFLNLKGKGAMHSSSGLAVSASDVLEMTPPEVLRYLLVRQSPRKHIDFDPGLGVLQLVDDFDRHERVFFGHEEPAADVTEVERVYQLSCPNDVPSQMGVQVPYRHLVTVVQLADSVEEAEAILIRSGELAAPLDPADKARLAMRMEHVQTWLNTFAPQNVRFAVQAECPDVKDEDKPILSALGKALAGIEWTPQAIHDTIHLTSTSLEMSQGQAFGAVYRSILGQDRGPRAGFFLASQDRDFVLMRFSEASK